MGSYLRMDRDSVEEFQDTIEGAVKKPLESYVDPEER